MTFQTTLVSVNKTKVGLLVIFNLLLHRGRIKGTPFSVFSRKVLGNLYRERSPSLLTSVVTSTTRGSPSVSGSVPMDTDKTRIVYYFP